MSSPATSGKKPSKPSILGRWANKFEPEPNPQFMRPSVREARTSSQATIQEPEAAPAVDEAAQDGDSPEAAAEDQYRSLWSRAADELGDESKYVRTECYTLHRSMFLGIAVEQKLRTEMC
jgi:hypothetical protein